MATIRGYTAERMKQIEDSTVVGGLINGLGRLILKTRDNTEIDAGDARGPQGLPGMGPPGSIIAYAAPTAPSGYLVCDGSTKSRTEYAALFAVIGTRFGAGDGVSTFNLPNLKGRVIAGIDTAQTEFDTLGEIGGAKTHTLTQSEMPSHTHVQNAHNHAQTAHAHTTYPHTHSINDPGHYHMQVVSAAQGNDGKVVRTDYTGDSVGSQYPQGANTNTAFTGIWNSSTHAGMDTTVAVNQAATATNQNTGGGGSHNNLQPYIALYYLIKT